MRCSCRGTQARRLVHCFILAITFSCRVWFNFAAIHACCAPRRSGIKLCVQTHGPTGKVQRRKVCNSWSSTWATRPTSTSWAGKHMWLTVRLRWSIYKISCLRLFVTRTKIFIRHPRTLFATEDAFQVCKHKLGETLPYKSGHSASKDSWRWNCLFLPQRRGFRPNTKATGWKRSTWNRERLVSPWLVSDHSDV